MNLVAIPGLMTPSGDVSNGLAESSLTVADPVETPQGDFGPADIRWIVEAKTIIITEAAEQMQSAVDYGLYYEVVTVWHRVKNRTLYLPETAEFRLGPTDDLANVAWANVGGFSFLRER